MVHIAKLPALLQVLMDQLWCYFYTCAKHPTMDLIRYPTQLEVKHMRQLLSILYTHGVDWTDPSAWPEDFVDGKWERQIPLPFLLENIGSGRNASKKIISAICEGDFARSPWVLQET